MGTAGGGAGVRRRLLLLALGSTLLAAGCRVDVHVDVAVAGGGAGQVTVEVALDEDAASQVPDLAEVVVVDDLVDAGWEVAPPSVADDGTTVLRAGKAFLSPAGADAIFDELTGSDGPFADLVLRREESVTATVHTLEGEVDLGVGIEVFGDAALREALGGSSFGLDVAELERRAGVPLEEAVTFELTADLPGRPVAGAPWRWEPRLGEVAEVSARSRRTHAEELWWGGAAAAALLALTVVLSLRWWRARGPA